MVHDSNFALTESIITALKEKFVTIFAGKPLFIYVTKDHFYKAYGTLPTKTPTDFEQYVTAA